jgi:hypothetical protein
MKELCEYWCEQYNWRSTENRLAWSADLSSAWSADLPAERPEVRWAAITLSSRPQKPG